MSDRYTYQSDGAGDYNVFDGKKQISSGLSLDDAEETVNRLNTTSKAEQSTEK